LIIKTDEIESSIGNQIPYNKNDYSKGVFPIGTTESSEFQVVIQNEEVGCFLVLKTVSQF
jgi:hypothetical protein